MTNSAPILSVVIPLYNEEAHIKDSAMEICQQVSNCESDYEILFVDDGSTDESWSVLKDLHSSNSSIRCFKLSRNFGKELALCVGLDHARGQAVIVMDADLQHPPELISELVASWRNGTADIIEACKRKRQQQLPLKRVLANIYHFIFGKLTGYDLRLASDFKLLDRKVIDAWSQLNERNTFFRGLAVWLGFKRHQIHFDVPVREHGKSKFSYLGLIELSIRSIISFSTVPLYLVPLIGVLFIIFSLIMAGIALIQWFQGSAFVGFTTVILLQLMTGGSVLIALGIIGVYIAKIYDEVKARPRYIVSDILA